MTNSPLFNEFRAVSTKEWKQKIQVDLKGADYNESLIWESPEGIKVKPFYNHDDSKDLPLQTSNSGNSWQITAPIYAGEAQAANKSMLHVLHKGATCLWVTIPETTISVNTLCKGVTELVKSIHFTLHFLDAVYVAKIVTYFEATDIQLYFHIDPIGKLTAEGNWHTGLVQDFSVLEELLETNQNNANVNVLGVSVAGYQNAGATITQQLAYALAHANEYLNYFYQKGKINTVTGLTFSVAVGGNYFFEIAKLRALRLLWDGLCAEYEVKIPCTIIAQPTKRNKTIYDYNVNMLRTTTEYMSAILGGANYVSTLAYDAIYHKSNAFGERIARNQLLLLKHESYFDQVENTADGSYYIESITHQLAEKSLMIFKQLETQGGFLSQLKAHVIQKKITESAAKEQAAFNAKEEVLIGANAQPNLSDKMKGELQLYPFVKQNPRKTLIAPIIEKRLAAPSEEKRLEDE